MKNPLIPMVAITGNPSKKVIDKIMNEYREKGIMQFLIYPRDGCEIEYMSERWIEVVSFILDSAKRCGIDIWLYDEFNWPSGSAGGNVMKENSDFYAKSVFVKDGEIKIEKYDRYADILNPDAADCFIRNTHEVYFKHFKNYFGTVIKGIFSDEPDFSVCTRNGGKYPYTKNLEKIYFERCKRDLFADMKAPAPPEEFNLEFWKMLGEMFRENFLRKINSWCTDHGIKFTGHMMNEARINMSVRNSGGTIAALREMSQPGIDDINTYTSVDTAEWLTLGSIEAAIRITKRGGLAELFAYGPTDIPPSRIEQMIWFTSMFKIDHYLLAVSAMDAKGNLKRNAYYNPMCYTNPWFKGYPELGRSALSASHYAKKSFTPDVVVRYPVTLASKYIFTDKENLIPDRIDSVLRFLVKNQYQWQLIDDDETAPDGAYLIEITDDDSFSLVKIKEELSQNVKRSLLITENGGLADEVFARRYDDSSFLVLDLKDSAEKRHLTLSIDGENKSFTLPGRGHFTSSDVYENEKIIKELTDLTFDLKLNSPSILRCPFYDKKKEFIFNCEDELNNVVIIRKNYLYDGEIKLDGKNVIADKKCTYLKEGLNNLYLASDSFTLSKGEHKITASDALPVEYFLPSCFIAGSFATDEEHNLRLIPDKVPEGRLDKNTLFGYSGGLSYITDIDIPSDALKITLDSFGLYTRVYLNGYFLGGSISSAPVWKIPPEYRGTNARLKIVQYTSVGPLFGTLKECIENPELPEMAHIKSHQPRCYQKCGVNNITFIK